MGLSTVAEVKAHTKASGGCGSCAERVGDILSSVNGDSVPGTLRRPSEDHDMAKLVSSKKACTVNPLKMSQPIGGALAFMGLRGCMPLLHGSQGCTSFGLVLFVRHFKEAIPLQTTAMSEVATVLGGWKMSNRRVLNIFNRTKPEIIGICSTGVTETKGDDVDGYIKLIRAKYPQLADFPLVYVSTPDFKDAFQDGWGKDVAKMVEVLVKVPEPGAAKDPKAPERAAGLPPHPRRSRRAAHHHRGLRLVPSFLPDLAGSLDGHIPDDFTPTTIGGIGVDEVATMGEAAWTVGIGAQMRPRGRGHGSEDRVEGAGVRALVRAGAERCVHHVFERDFGPAGAAQVPPAARTAGGCHAGRPLPPGRTAAGHRR